MSRDKMKMIERCFNVVFQAFSPEEEWRHWHERTTKKITEIKQCDIPPVELVDVTEVKYYSWLADKLVSMIDTRISTMLEVGCGSGALSLRISERTGAACTILDNEPIALEYARCIFSDQSVQFVLGDATMLPFEGSEYDLVHSVGLIEHFPDDVIETMVQEMVRVTKVGGHIYVAVPNYFSPDLMMTWLKYRKGSERYMPISKLVKYFDKRSCERVGSGHSEFVFCKKWNAICPIFFEKILGRIGFGFLNYVVVKKVSS